MSIGDLIGGGLGDLGNSAQGIGTDWIAKAQQSGSRVDYAHAFLQALGAPQSNGNLALLLSVMQNESTRARFNPMASTWGAPGATDMPGNTAHVKDYADVASAIAAQVEQWRKVFPTITASLMSDTASSSLSSHEWDSYSGNNSGSYQQKLIANYQRFSGDPTAGDGLVGTTGGSGGAAGGGAAGGGPSSAYQQYGFLLHDPQVGPLLQQLSSGGISDATFLSELQSTPWWQKNSGSARSWQQLQYTDPGSYDQQLSTYSRQIVEQAMQMGVGLDPATILNLANQWGMHSWQPQDVTDAILNYSNAGKASGGLAYGEQQVQQAAASYGIKLNPQQSYQYELGIAKNQQTLNGLTANFAQQAKQMYPHLAQQLDQGFTLQQIAQPYINSASQTLEVNPDSIDLSNPKWSRALAFHDGKQVRQMTQYEWQQTLMQDPTYGYDHTQNAQQSAASLGVSLVGKLTGAL